MSSNQWSYPGGFNWNAFVSQVQLYASLCQRAKEMDLALWNIGTFKEVMKWCDFMENMHDSLTDHDVHQLEQYLKDPKSFSAAGEEDSCIVLISGITVTNLGRATHFILRRFLSNPSLRRNHFVLKSVLSSYLKMIDVPEDKPEVIGVMAKDLTREISPEKLETSYCLEWLHLNGNRIADKMPLALDDIHDQEVRYFLRRPEKIKLFGLSRCLIAKLKETPSATLPQYCDKIVKKCRKNGQLLEVVLLSMVERGLFMTSKTKKQNEEKLSPPIIHELVEALLTHQAWLDIWNSTDLYVLARVASVNFLFSQEWEEAK